MQKSKENGLATSSSSSAAGSLSNGHSSSNTGSLASLPANSARLAAARRVHHEVCSLLLGAYESLQYAALEFSNLLPEGERPRLDMADCARRLESLSDMAKVKEGFSVLLCGGKRDGGGSGEMFEVFL